MKIDVSKLIDALSPYFWRKKSNNEMGGNIIPSIGNAFDIGSATRPIRRIYAADIIGTQGSVDELVAVSIGTDPGYLSDVLVVSGEMTKSVAGNNLSIGIGSSIVRDTRQLFAGSGLTGGGALSSDVTISLSQPGQLSATTTNSASGAHTHSVLTGIAVGLSATTSNATGVSSSLARADHTHAIATGIASTISVSSVNSTGTSSNLARADHTHTITSSSDVTGGQTSLLASLSGNLSLVNLTSSTSVRTPLLDTASGNLSISPAGDVVFNPGGKDILPSLNYDLNIGMLSKKYLTLHAAELWVETLVAQNTIATIGGRILVGPTTTLTRDVATGDTQIYVRHNQMVSGDRAYMEADGKVEFFAITSAATTISATEYRYNVTRNLDGSGANAWFAGDALFNTGQTGSGFIDLYSVRGVKSASQAGPTIVGNLRNSATYNDWSEAWAIGNLNGLYGYGSNTVGVGLGKYASGQPNVVIDPTNGVRLRQYTTDMIVLDPSGNSYFAGVMTIGASGEIRQGTGTIGSDFTGLRIWRDGNVGRIAGYNANTLQWWAGTDGRLYAAGGNVRLDQTGISVQADPAAESDSSSYRFVNSGGTTIGGDYVYTAQSNFETTNAFIGQRRAQNIWGLTDNAHHSIQALGTGNDGKAVVSLGAYNLAGRTVVEIKQIGATSELGVLAAATTLSGSLLINGHLGINTNNTFDLGTASKKWRAIYVGQVIADTISGTTMSGQEWEYAGNMVIDANSASNTTVSVTNQGAGVASLGVEGNITLGGTVDGVDIASHAGNVNAHHARDHVLATNTGLGATHTISGATAGHVLRASSGTAAAFAAIQDGDLPSTIVRTSRQVIAGNGLTGGGALSADRTLNVGAGTLITVGADTVGISTGAAYQFIGTGSGTSAAWQNMSTLAGNGLSHSNGVLTVGAGDGITVGATTVGLTTPGGLSATTTNSASGSHTHAIDSTIARSAIDIAAGNGLTGGGNLTANRTLTLGTPSDLTASTTNAVTSTSHTHAISTAAAVGLSATTTNAAGTSASLARADHTHAITANVAASALTVASTAAVGTSAALARADHIHAITTSSNPGAAASILSTNSSGYLRLVRLGIGKDPTSPLDVSGAAAISGALSAGSGAITGALTVGQNFTVGANVLFVNQSGTRVGINTDASDAQFDLDVAGAIRGQYLIGKHAIQLSSAVGVWHFDGAAPYTLDSTGSNASHVGIGGTESGHVIYRPGKFGKSVQVAHGTTNLLLNPSFEYDAAGGGASNWADYTSNAGVAPTGTRTVVDSLSLYGGKSYRLIKTGGSDTSRWGIRANFAVTSGLKYTFSCWINVTAISGGARQVYGYMGTNVTAVSVVHTGLTSGWKRLSVTTTATATGLASFYVWIHSATTATVFVDGCQVEQREYATPYHDGSLTSPTSWGGTAHASSSTRSGATLAYDNNAGLNSDEGSIMMWALHAGLATGGMGLWGTGSNAQFDAYVDVNGTIYYRQNGVNLSFAAGIQPGTWNHYAFTWSRSSNTRKIFVNGVEKASRQFDTGATLGTSLFVGSITAGATYGVNGNIDEFVLLDYSADPKLIRAIYESDAPVFVESSVFHWRSPSRVPIWVDEFGFWARGVSGNEILGLYGGDPRNPTGNVTRSWGGINMEENDVVIGRAAQEVIHWDDSAGTLLIGKPSAANILLSGGALRLRSGTTDKIVLDSGGNASFSGSITSTSGTIGGWTLASTTLTGGNVQLDSTGKIRVGSASADRLWIDATNATYRLWAGNDTPASASFSVTKTGVLYATGATISGAITATSGSFSGSITSTSGTIGGWTLASTTLTGGNAQLDAAGKIRIGAASADRLWIDATNATHRLWVGNDTAASASFSVTKAGVLYATGATISGTITATSGSFTGSITSTSGTIGGWTIGSALSATNLVLTPGAANTAHILAGTSSTAGGVNSAGATGDIVFWAGSTHANRASAAFRVTAGGALTATNATITGAITATSGSFTGSITSTSGTIGGWTIGSGALSSGTVLMSPSSGLTIYTADNFTPNRGLFFNGYDTLSATAYNFGVLYTRFTPATAGVQLANTQMHIGSNMNPDLSAVYSYTNADGRLTVGARGGGTSGLAHINILARHYYSSTKDASIGLVSQLNLSTISLTADSIFATGKTGGAWTTLTLTSPWGNNGSGWAAAQYAVFGDWVVIKGLVTPSSNQAANATIATLPAAIRPSENRRFGSYAAGAGCALDVLSTGVVRFSVAVNAGQSGSIECMYKL